MPEQETTTTETDELLAYTTKITAAYVSNNSVSPDTIPAIIHSVYASLLNIGNARNSTNTIKPAVPIKKSLTDDYIVCLEDGKKLKMLKRYLRSHHDMSPDEYRTKWQLPADYPMVAPAYAAKRSEFAKKIGLGKKT